jgi:ABC-2 type transport system permease protein
MNQYLRSTLGITRAYLLRFTRDKVALFFTLLFPLIFLFVFGSIFNSNSVSFKLAVVDDSKTDFARTFTEDMKKSDTFKITDVSGLDDAKQKMSRGEIDSIVVLPPQFGALNEAKTPHGKLDVYYQKGKEQSGQTVAAVMQSILDGVNAQFGRPAAALGVEQKATNDSGLSQFDYTFSGLLGFTILSMGIFGLANSMPQEKKTGAFRRLRASPFTAGQLILGNGLYYIIISLVSIAAMFIVGTLVFNFNMRGSWLSLLPFILLSTWMMIGFGLLIGGWARNENQSAPVSNLIAFPMMFLSGAFFPRFMFPEFLQNITAYIPLSPVVDGLRRIMTENAHLTDLGPELAIIVVWGVVVYALAIKLFRWE